MFVAISQKIRSLGCGIRMRALGSQAGNGYSRACVFVVVFVSTQMSHGEVVLFEDGFENGNTNGWIIDGPDDTALNGAWEFGDPIGTVQDGAPAQPETAFSGAACAFTEQNLVGQVGHHDVDKGAVYLMSPMLDLSGYSSVRIDYVRWYYVLYLDVDPDDYFVAQVRDSVGSEWVDLERLDDSAPENSWTSRSFLLESLIDLTPTVQIRFGASDGNLLVLGNVIEAAVDDVRIVGLDSCEDNTDCDLEEYCSQSGECLPFGNGDVDLDGDVDMTDYVACLACVGINGSACAPCNVAGDETVQVDDLAACAQILSGPSN